jgi:hypothetical protein
MRIMADATILRYRGMLIDKRSLIFRMAIVTEVVYRALCNIFLLRVMGIVTTAALHLPFPDGVV